MCLLRASPRGAQAHPSSPPAPAPAAVAARDLGRQAPFELLKDQPSWKSQLATIRPFPPTARCAFVWAARLEDSPSLWVAWRCSFRRPRRGAKQVSRVSSQQVTIFALVLSGVTKLLFLESICWLMHSFTWCVFTPHLCVVDHVNASDPAVSVGGMFSVLWELPLRTGDKEKEEKVTGAGDTAVQTTDWRQKKEGGGVPPAARVLDGLSEEEMEGPDVKRPDMGKESRCFWTEQQLPWPHGRKAEETFSQGTLKGASRGFRD